MLAEIQAGVVAMRSLASLGVAAFELKNAQEIASKVFDIQRDAAAAMSALLSALAENSDLQGKLREAENKLHALEDKQTRLANYRTHQFDGGQFCVAPIQLAEGEPAHFACINCFQLGRISILHMRTAKHHDEKGTYTTYMCSNKECHVAVRQTIGEGVATNRRPSSWMSRY